ncbi:hypothetical protein [Mucilaginibacter aquariorum]|uniref:Uncharacterized protein n=1 Tax=Mucilaginibacter aquariorum TaxID=2967225 RepID=A0ABT1T7B3_9SPHI|nr:hypothetical protein [Mucilaginibacter aquariorum]MCQ6960126.1 hypothetical protein [Mucilaginibacter aquariorum]
MINHHYPNPYLYRGIVQVEPFINAHYADSIELNNIVDEAYFSK